MNFPMKHGDCPWFFGITKGNFHAKKPWGAERAIGGVESDEPPESGPPSNRGLIILKSLKKRGGSWWLPSGKLT